MKTIAVKSLLLLSLFNHALIVLAAPPGTAENNNENAATAIRLYQQQSYKSAADAFEALFKISPPDAKNLYYAALSNAKCGQNARAEQLFKYIIANFPKTQSAQYAQTALKSLLVTHSEADNFSVNRQAIDSAAIKAPPKTVNPISTAGRAKGKEDIAPTQYTQMFFECRLPECRKILFIGNSLTFTNQLPLTLAALALNSRTCSDLRLGEVVEGGATLDHMYNNTNAVKAILQDGPWTDVVLQDQSEAPLKSPASTLEYSERFAKEIAKINARPVFFETWSLNGRQETQSQFHDVYAEAARNAGGLFVPAGDAFAMCHAEHPEIDLYGDDRHPNQQGTYLAACVFYKKFFGRTPVGLPNDLALVGIKVMTINPNVAAILQQIALKAATAN